MEKYLNEEQYQKNKKKIINTATILIILGIILAITLLVTGFAQKTSNSNKTKELDKQINTLQQEISILDWQMTNEFQQNGLSAKYYELDGQRAIKQEQLSELKMDKFDLGNNSHIILFAGSAFVLLLFGGIAGRLYFIAYRRNIAAFTVQQTMPIAQEGLEKMAPTLGKVSEEIAKGVSKGKSQNKK